MSEPPSEQSPRTLIEWNFWFQWLLASTLGWAIGWAFIGEGWVGGVMGLGQWLVLRPLVPQAGWWILASAGGWLAGWLMIVSGLIIPPEAGPTAAVIGGGIIGTWVGLAQWILLRRWVQRAGWWILVNAVSWSVGLTGLFGWTVVGAVVGAVTGFTLDFLLREPVNNNPD